MNRSAKQSQTGPKVGTAKSHPHKLTAPLATDIFARQLPPQTHLIDYGPGRATAPAAVLQLQRTLGNRVVSGLVGGRVQRVTKLNGAGVIQRTYLDGAQPFPQSSESCKKVAMRLTAYLESNQDPEKLQALKAAAEAQLDVDNLDKLTADDLKALTTLSAEITTQAGGNSSQSESMLDLDDLLGELNSDKPSQTTSPSSGDASSSSSSGDSGDLDDLLGKLRGDQPSQTTSPSSGDTSSSSGSGDFGDLDDLLGELDNDKSSQATPATTTYEDNPQHLTSEGSKGSGAVFVVNSPIWFHRPPIPEKGTWGLQGQIAEIVERHADQYKVRQPDGLFQIPGASWITVTGYVDKQNVAETPLVRERRNAKWGEEEGPLFAQPPTTADVFQGGIGDCWLLAALMSIVAQNPAQIPKMMTDNGKTVTVLLYDIQQSDSGKTFSPRLVTVTKSSAQSAGGAALTSTGALWVRILEKAYMAAGFTGSSPQTIPNPSLGMIESGFANIAFEHLLGQPATTSAVNTAGEYGTASQDLPWNEAELYTIAAAQKNFSNLPSYNIFTRRGVSDTAQLQTLVELWQQAITPVLGMLYHSKQGDYARQLRLEDFGNLFNRRDLLAAKPATDHIMAWLEQSGLFPGKRGTNRYSDAQVETYNRIKTALQENRHIVADSVQQVGHNPNKKGRSGEDTSKGLVGPHAYTVLAVSPPADASKRIRVRNPWGSYGRDYDDKGHAIESEAAAEFWLELSDFTKRFERIHLS